MNASLITIGEELLIGQVIDTNSAWLGQKLNNIGIRVNSRISVPDEPDKIENAINQALSENAIVITTGGLGPTSDDKTKNVLCKFFNCELVEHAPTLELLKQMFAKRNFELTEKNKSQALVPNNAIVLKNELGTAPGLYFKNKGKHLFALPGVPFEMKGLFETHIKKILTNEYGQKALIHENMIVSGIGESFLSDLISEWENNLPKDVSLAYLPSPGLNKLRISTYSPNIIDGREKLKKLFSELKKIIGDYFVSDKDEMPNNTLFSLLKKTHKTICTAESCTGGYIAEQITSISGSSEIYKGSIVSYDNSIKENVLGIPKNIIEKNGAVSKEVVEMMATSVLKIMNCDYSIATSGIAGPNGGSIEKPVGTVWIAIANKQNVFSKKFIFGNLRDSNIKAATNNAFHMIINSIRKDLI